MNAEDSNIGMKLPQVDGLTFFSKHKKQSICYPESCSIKENGVKLPKLGVVKARILKTISSKIKSVTGAGLLTPTFDKNIFSKT